MPVNVTVHPGLDLYQVYSWCVSKLSAPRKNLEIITLSIDVQLPNVIDSFVRAK